MQRFGALIGHSGSQFALIAAGENLGKQQYFIHRRKGKGKATSLPLFTAPEALPEELGPGKWCQVSAMGRI